MILNITYEDLKAINFAARTVHGDIQKGRLKDLFFKLKNYKESTDDENILDQ